jgi:hypothetical protein
MSAHPQLQYADRGIAGFHNILETVALSAAPRDGILFHVTSSEALALPHVFAGRGHVDYERVKRTPMAEAQARICSMLAALFPTAHVLVVTRGFRSMILSSYSQYVRSGGHATLAEAFQGGWEAWDYDHLIHLYSGAFGDRLIVMPYELLRDDREAFTRELETRLGLQHFAMMADRVSPALSAVELAWYPRLTLLLRSLPISSSLQEALYGLHARAMLTHRYRPFIAMLQRVWPIPPFTADSLDDEIVSAFAGKAECLRENPLFAPYRSDYLL